MPLYRRKAEGAWWIRISVAGRKIRKTTGTANREDAKEFGAQGTGASLARTANSGTVLAAVPWREAAARWLTETRKKTKSKDEYMLAWFGGYLDNEPLSATLTGK